MTTVNLEILENVPLAPLTTLGVGGQARFLVHAHSMDEVEQALRFAREGRLKVFILGGGSNVVISDRGFDGLVLQMAIDGITERRAKAGAGAGAEDANRGAATETACERVTLDVGAGVDWDEFVALCVSRNYGGVECLSGIPGSVGGTPVQNVGAYGQEVSETIVSVLAYDLHEHRVRELQHEDCGFSYRSSVFNSTERGRYIILLVTYRLQPGALPALRYGDLEELFASKPEPTLAEVREAVLKVRARKGMVIHPNDPDSRSAGSFFKNPILSPEQFAELEQKTAARGLKAPRYPALSQQSKISAAWLVENSGFYKGYSQGAVGISSKHALAIINRGGARAAEIVALRNEIQSKVEQTWGVRLEPEPVFVGF
jgi:UDP-N-acetylmuramate dehydrogenase